MTFMFPFETKQKWQPVSFSMERRWYIPYIEMPSTSEDDIYFIFFPEIYIETWKHSFDSVNAIGQRIG